jgi:hypothetical protein
MSSRRCNTLATVVFTVFFSTNARTVEGEHRLLTPEQTQIVNTVSTVFTAARTDDVAKFNSVIAPDFYIFDGGADSTETPSWPLLRHNMPGASATNGT